MGFARAAGGLRGSVLGLIALLPPIALAVCAALDRGPDGDWRASPFPAALVLLDPLTWDCLRHSALVAGAVAFGSFLLGVPIGRLLARWRFWGRGILTLLVTAPIAVPPLVGAIGLRSWFDPALPSPFVGPGASAMRPWTWGLGAAWWCWLWVGLSFGVGWVARAVIAALEAIDPGWEEAARATGASSRRCWRSIAWPLVRPTALRGALLVFGLVLVEPSVPLLLRLRPTLGYQIVEEALANGPSSRAAILALLGLGVATALLLLSRVAPGPSRLDLSQPPRFRPRRAPWWRAGPLVLVLGAWTVLAWAPALLLLATIRTAVPDGSGPSVGWLRPLVDDPDLRRAVLHSALVGLLAGTTALVIARLSATPTAGRTGPRLAFGGRGVISGRVPSVIAGVGVLAIPALLRAAGRGLERALPSAGPGRVVAELAGAIDPFLTPWSGLVAALALVHLPMAIGAVGLSRRRRLPAMEEIARGLGAPAWRAWWDVSRPGALPPLLGAWLLAAVLAATDVGASLVLTPTLACRPIGPTILDFADTPGRLEDARLLAVVALALSLGGFLLASRWAAGGPGPADRP